MFSRMTRDKASTRPLTVAFLSFTFFPNASGLVVVGVQPIDAGTRPAAGIVGIGDVTLEELYAARRGTLIDDVFLTSSTERRVTGSRCGNHCIRIDYTREFGSSH